MPPPPGEEGGPSLTAWWRAADLAQVPLDGSVGDANVELEELTADALGAPQAILVGHAADEGDDVGPNAGRGGGFFRERHFQSRRNPSRCQRRRVSGLTSRRAVENSLERARRRTWSRARNWGLFDPRAKTVS
jgi:hypothetical protein